jgi:hypothetical protein
LEEHVFVALYFRINLPMESGGMDRCKFLFYARSLAAGIIIGTQIISFQ